MVKLCARDRASALDIAVWKEHITNELATYLS